MSALYEKTSCISRVAGADYSQPGVGQYRFAVVNPNPIAAGSYTSPSKPGLWYGTAAGAPAIPDGNVLVNTVAGGDCDFIIVGKSLPGEPIECAFAGRTVVLVGAGGVTAGEAIMSDATGAAVNHTSTNHILGTALSDAAAGTLVDILFVRRGEV